MAFYEVLIQASQVVYVEADSEDEALDVALIFGGIAVNFM